MFTGIIQSLVQVTHVENLPHMMKYNVCLSPDLLEGLKIGASIAIDGVCQTVARMDGNQVGFDAIQETLDRTTLGCLNTGNWVNLERAARFGDEIGGHFLSGHVYGKARIFKIETPENNWKVSFKCEADWMKYFFSKGFIALDGVSLTLVDVDPHGNFSVHLIPETLQRTTLGRKTEGQWVNVEFDSQTQTIVETIERLLKTPRGVVLDPR